jgi:hypothetical protein
MKVFFSRRAYYIMILYFERTGAGICMREIDVYNYAAGKKQMCIDNDTISDSLFDEYGVNRGLRDVNGKGVLTGLTRISKIVSFKDEDGMTVPCDGELSGTADTT